MEMMQFQTGYDILIFVAPEFLYVFMLNSVSLDFSHRYKTYHHNYIIFRSIVTL